MHRSAPSSAHLSSTQMAERQLPERECVPGVGGRASLASLSIISSFVIISLQFQFSSFGRRKPSDQTAGRCFAWLALEGFDYQPPLYCRKICCQEIQCFTV